MRQELAGHAKIAPKMDQNSAMYYQQNAVNHKDARVSKVAGETADMMDSPTM